MAYIDLTHKITNNTPVYPGTEAPIINHPFTIDQHGFAESKLTLFSHIGTHMDAPSHMLKEGEGLDVLAVDQFIGKGMVIDVSHVKNKVIGLDVVKAYELQLNQVTFVLFYTGWAQRWAAEDYFDGFPTLSVEAAGWLAEYPLKGIGIDAISIDTMETTTFPVHQLLMRKSMVIIENLMNLDRLINKYFTLCALPLKFDQSDGAPIRAVAQILSDFCVRASE